MNVKERTRDNQRPIETAHVGGSTAAQGDNTDRLEKAREARLRRKAARQGLYLQKTRIRTGWLAGTYHLLDAHTGNLDCWGSQSGFGLNIDEVEKILDEPEPEVL